MSTCCSSANKQAIKKMNCPMCQTQSNKVENKTLLYMLKQPWKSVQNSTSYYFCSQAECQVIYFNSGGDQVYQTDIRKQVGIKQKNEEAVLCYCFDISYKDFEQKSDLKDYVIDKTRNGDCSCDIQNPSGRCCLKDFPK